MSEPSLLTKVPTRRVLILLILLTMLPTLAIGVLSYLRFMHSATLTVKAATDRIAQELGRGIEEHVGALLSSVDLPAENREVRAFYNRYREDPASAWAETEPGLAQYFDRFFEVFGEQYLQVTYLSASGEPLFKMQRSEGKRPEIGEKQKTVLIRDAFTPQDRADPEVYAKLAREEEAFRSVLAQVPPYGRVLRVYRWVPPSGLMIADLRPEVLWSRDPSSMVFGAQGYIAIVDRTDDRLLFHTEALRSGKEITEAYPGLRGRYEEMKRPKRGWVRFDADGEEGLVSYVNLTSPPWTVLVAASAGEFLRRPRATGMINVGVTAGFVILATVAIFYLWGTVRERTEALSQANRTLESAYQELRATEAQLVQSEKMASLGQLVAGIAHELNNPISFVYANTHYLRKALDELKGQFQRREEDLRAEALFRRLEDLLEGCRHGAERAKQIVTDLRTFSRLDEAEFKPADLHEGIESTLTLLSHRLKDRITVHREYGEIPPIECYPGPLNQVFMNLLANAAEAIQGKGDIWIQTERDGDEVVISIRDNGVGIPEAHSDKLFTPFFTTKEVGRGTGLGLSVTYGIIQKHGGQISVESKVGEGSTFTVRLSVRASSS